MRSFNELTEESKPLAKHTQTHTQLKQIQNAFAKEDIFETQLNRIVSSKGKEVNT